jgi:hypothetical protein
MMGDAGLLEGVELLILTTLVGFIGYGFHL